MNHGYFFFCTVVFFIGLACVRFGYKAFGGTLIGIVVTILMIDLPWRAAEALSAHHLAFRHWFAPHHVRFILGWGLASMCLGLAAALGAAGFKPGPNEADWETPKDSPAVDKALAGILRDKSGVDETLLGVTKSRWRASLSTRERDGHMQIVGPTRTGKSQLLLSIAAQDMKAKLPMFFMEAKGDCGDFEQFLKIAALAGREDSVRYFNPQDDCSMTFNPIRPVSGQDATAIANQIARAIGREATSSGEGQDYYRAVDYAKLQTMAEVFFATGRAFTLRDCYYYFAFPEAREKALKLCSDRRLIELARSEFKVNPDSSGLTAALRPWTSGRLGELLNSYSPQIRLEDVFQQGQSAYFAIPIGHLQTLANPLGRMVISGLLSIAAARQRAEHKPKPATIILDEFSEFATPVFASFIATVGSARLRTILSHQDLGQLKRVEGMDTDAFESVIFNNTSGCKVVFRSPDPDDAEFWAAMMGTHIATRDTERLEGGILGGKRQTGSVSRRIVERFKIHPNVIKSLPPGAAIVMAPGRAECVVRTARVHQILNKLHVPKLPTPTMPAEKGLDLRAAVPDYDEAPDLGEVGA